MFVGCVDFDLLLDVVSCHAVVDLSNSCNDSNKYNSDNRSTTPDQCSICSLQFYIRLKLFVVDSPGVKSATAKEQKRTSTTTTTDDDDDAPLT